jgi:starch synthase (maltosyl-transferring)
MRESDPTSWPGEGRARVVVEGVTPEVDGGRYPVKRVLGDRVTVEADLLIDGHDKLAGVLWYETPAGARLEVPLQELGNDRYGAEFVVSALGLWHYGILAWVDVFASWCWGLGRKLAAGVDVTLELREGAGLIRSAAGRAQGEEAGLLRELAGLVDPMQSDDRAQAVVLAQGSELRALMDRWRDRSLASAYDRELPLVVDPIRARYSTWYEMFPRSAGRAGSHGTFRDVEARLNYVAAMGFDVLYLPPIHPIGRSHRKGPNNTVTAPPGAPGSPWAIGASDGGHKDIHQELGTLADFSRLVAKARSLGIELALDIAFQVSPDHPYVRQHPEWFRHRADGSIQYAENPPKKYQDVYPFDFESPAWYGLWEELASVFAFWIEQGVRIFRVDNPHTKPLPFWRWCLDRIKRKHPEVIFLAEAFTRPKLMNGLAKAGFSQSYTYFTWRTTKHELSEYMQRLVCTDQSDYFRPNLWPNTPDILPEHLQFGTRGTFIARAVLAGTLSASYGVYGPPFELLERTAREGAEEYVDNEKFEIRNWDLEQQDGLQPVLRRLNQIRRDNPALQENHGLRFHAIDNDLLLAYSKQSADGSNTVLVVVSLDAHHVQSGWLTLDANVLGAAGTTGVQVHDQLQDTRYIWRDGRAYVELDPVMPAHIFRLRHRTHSEKTFEYYL